MELNVIQEMQVQWHLDGWGVAGRDDTKLAQAIAQGEPVDAVYTLEDEAALDEFLHYLQVRGLIPLFEQLATAMRVERVNVPPALYLWLYFTKLILGIEGMAKMSPLLLRDEALMRLLGFNAHQIAHGVTQRGDSRRELGTEREGPVSTEAVSDNVVKFSVFALARFFNGVIQRIVPLMIPEGDLDIVIDCSLYETTENFKGATRTSRTEKKRDIHGKWVELRKTIWGWKIGLAYHPMTGIPLAVCVSKINADDRSHFWTLMEDVKKNLGCKRIRSVAMDRGFLDGEDLWRLQQQSIEFIVPAKANMHVYRDALDLVRRYGKDPRSPEVQVQRWSERRNQGHGRQATTTEVATEIVGVPLLQTFETYGPPGHGDKQDQKDFKPNPINAVVVSEWRGRRFKTPKVFLTNGAVSKPRLTFDRYDDRSLIENGLFREGKQAWSLERPPKRSEAGVTVHVYLTYVAMALTRCYQFETQQQALPATAVEVACRLDRARLERQRRQTTAAPVAVPPAPTATPASGRKLPTPRHDLGMERYRLELLVQNRNRVILFQGNNYGILHVQEMAMLSGVNLLERSPGVGSREETFLKFEMEPPPPPPPVRLIARPPSKRRPRKTRDWDECEYEYTND
jgi:hypothetical protein